MGSGIQVRIDWKAGAWSEEVVFALVRGGP
jgi:hypothetical protein